MTTQSMRILWCVDALNKNKKNLDQAELFFQSLAKTTHLEVTPLFIENDLYFNAPVLHEKAKKNLTKLTKSPRFAKYLQPAKIINSSHSFFSVSSQVSNILDYTSKEPFDWILTHTANKTGLSRLFLGSFAETLILKSQHPLIVLPRKSELTKKSQKILFPSPLDEDSFKAFKKLISLCQKLKMDLVIYHNCLSPLTELTSKSLSEYKKRLKIEKWQDYAKKMKVKIKFDFEKIPELMSDSIVISAQSNKCQFIALQALSGQMESFFLGSTARQVARSSSLPVWIFH